MDTKKPKRSGWKLALPFVAITVVLATAAGDALAAIGVGVGDPQLSANRGAITVPVTVTCSPFDPTLTVFTTEVSVTIEQAPSGRAVGGLGAGYPSAMVFPCDGTSRTLTVTATTSLNASQVHPGPATVTVFVRARAGIPCPGTPLCFGFVETQSTTVTAASHVGVGPSASGTPKEVGARIGVFGGASQTFPAAQPFHFSHGWVTTPSADSLGLWRVSLTLDGVEVKPSVIEMIQIEDPVFGHLIQRRYVWNFPLGLTGTHVFGATFEGPCEPLVAAGLATGPCPTPNAVVPSIGFPVSTTVTFAS